MNMRMTTLALVSAAVLGAATSAQAQNSTGNRANDPALNSQPGASGTQPNGAMPERQNENMGTTGQGGAAAAPQNGGVEQGSPSAGGRVDRKDQQ